MDKLGKLVALVALSVFSAAGFGGDDAVDGVVTAAAETSAAAKDQLEKRLSTYQERLANNDIEGILDLYSSAPVFIPEYAPPAVGRDAVRKAYEWVFATLKLRGRFIVHEAEVVGDTAWVRTNSTGRFTVLATGMEGDVANSELFVFKRENNAWKIHRYIFTSAAPPPAAK
jgi:ketosteroid isomerase-like protein